MAPRTETQTEQQEDQVSIQVLWKMLEKLDAPTERERDECDSMVMAHFARKRAEKG